MENLDPEIIENLSTFIYESIPIIYKEIIEPNNNDVLLFSSIYYYQSAIDAIKRENDTNSLISGTIHPGYLVDKNYFVFQEDQIIDLSVINKTTLQNYVNTVEDQNLANFISSNNSSKGPFNELYKYYASTEDFNSYLDDLISAPVGGENSIQCLIGSGNDIGCCGNYAGCCLAASMVCYIHDIQCSTCKPPTGYPSWYCGPSCQPTTPGTKVVRTLFLII